MGFCFGPEFPNPALMADLGEFAPPELQPYAPALSPRRYAGASGWLLLQSVGTSADSLEVRPT